MFVSFFFFQAEDGIRDLYVTGVQTCALPIYPSRTVLVAGGIGAFTPRKLPLKDADHWYGRGLYDRILDPAVFSGKRVLLVGGGRSEERRVGKEWVSRWCALRRGKTSITCLIP